jgi:hypothetical protein
MQWMHIIDKHMKEKVASSMGITETAESMYGKRYSKTVTCEQHNGSINGFQTKEESQEKLIKINLLVSLGMISCFVICYS